MSFITLTLNLYRTVYFRTANVGVFIDSTCNGIWVGDSRLRDKERSSDRFYTVGLTFDHH